MSQGKVIMGATLVLDDPDPTQGEDIHLTASGYENDLSKRYPNAGIKLNVFDADGNWVYADFTGLGWGAYPVGGKNFTLAANSWPSGSGGHAEAELFGQTADGEHRGKTLASLEFEVAP